MAEPRYRRFLRRFFRKIVKKWQKDGWPKVKQWETEFFKLSPEQYKLFHEFVDLTHQLRRLYDEDLPANSSIISRVSKRLIIVTYRCLEAGLGYFDNINELAVGGGFIPDPATGGKYYRVVEGPYFCWECDTKVLEREDGSRYCPKCEGEQSVPT